jgi:hypothetical protein
VRVSSRFSALITPPAREAMISGIDLASCRPAKRS